MSTVGFIEKPPPWPVCDMIVIAIDNHTPSLCGLSTE